MRGTLNSFQRTMRQWNQLHAYNAVHAVQVPESLDQARLAKTINDFLTRHGLTELSLAPKRPTFDYIGGKSDVSVRVVPGGENPQTALAAEMQRQLNTAFPGAGTFCPFRFFAIDATDSFLLGLVYFHVIADAESIVWLLKGLATAYTGGQQPERRERVALYPRRYDNLLRHQPRVLLRRLAGLPAQNRNLRSSMRVPHSDPNDMRNGLRLFCMPPDRLAELITTAQAWEVTVNDLLLARLFKSLAPLTGKRDATERRRNLSLGCIVNVRKDLGLERERTFGLFLGSFMVTQAVPESQSLRRLAEDLRDQTRTIKRHRLYLGTPLELGIARRVLAFFSPAQRKKFYQKNYPLWGGITNMNMNVRSPATAPAANSDYFRAVSTGPVTPLVLSVTTVGDHANLGLTYRCSCFSESAIGQIQQTLLSALDIADSGT